MTIKIVAQIASVIGAILAVLGYLLISTEKVTGKSIGYHVINLAAGILLMFSSIVIFNVGNVLLNAVWMCIAAVTVVRLLRK